MFPNHGSAVLSYSIKTDFFLYHHLSGNILTIECIEASMGTLDVHTSADHVLLGPLS